jgi:hypothetical protein
LVFCHSKGIVGRAIRLAERIRWRGGDAYNHVAILAEPVGSNDWRVIQAEARGVTDTGLLSTIAPGGSYTIVPLPAGVSHLKVVDFARAQVGRRYGVLTIVSNVVTILTPKFISFRRPWTFICSGLATAALWYGGWVPVTTDVADMYEESPALLWEALDS